MPNFAASLTDGSGNVALSADGTNITIGDYSNYIASTQAGHAQARFNTFKRVIVENPDASTYQYSTLGDGDETIAVPSTYSATPVSHIYNYQDNGNGDGVYKITLRTAPTYVKGTTYGNGDCVYYDTVDAFYQSTASGNTFDPASVGSPWTEITEENLPATYQVYERIAIVCDLKDCYADLLVSANCVELHTNCDDVELCENDTFRAAVRLSMILESVEILADNEDWVQAEENINSGKVICSCCL